MSESNQGTLQSLQESLSAVIDGEADDLQLRRVLDATEKDAELRAKWERLHLIGSAIRSEMKWQRTELRATARPGSLEGADSMRAAAGLGLPAAAIPARAGTPAPRLRWLAPVASVAVAAAAALAVVLYFGPDHDGVPATPIDTLAESASERGTLASQGDALPLPRDARSVPHRNLAQVPSELDLRRANAYLLQHAHHTSVATRTAAMPPFVKVLTVRDEGGRDDNGGSAEPRRGSR